MSASGAGRGGRTEAIADQGRRSLDRAREALDRGRRGTALRHGWTAAMDGARAGDATLLADVRRLAETVADDRSAKESDDAEKLVRYCEELARDQRAGIKPAGLLDGLFSFRRERTKRCPDCAEKIKADARVCRFCGYRYPDAD